MSRPRKYKSNAERQRAYRERQKAKEASQVRVFNPETGEEYRVEVVSTSDLSDYRGPDPK